MSTYLLPPGIHHGVSDEAYRSDPGYSQSTLKKFGTAKSPLHFRYDEDHPPDQDTTGLRIGSYVDYVVFERTPIANKFAFWDSGRRAGKVWDEFKEANAEKTILTVEELQRAEACVAAMLANEDAAAALKFSHHQVTIIAVHPTFGYRLKGRLDLKPKKDIDWIYDWKSACDASSPFFHKLAHDKGYSIQAEYYLALCEYVGEPAGNFGFFVGETEPPYGVQTHYFERESAELVAAGKKIDEWLVRYHQCKTENVWPSYTPDWKRIRFKGYMLAEDREPEVLV